MAKDRFEKLRALFDQAMSLNAEERDTFLAAEEQSDPELARALADLVRNAGDETSYSEAVGAVAAAALTESTGGAVPAGSRIGNVEILRLIGTGGMGHVYLGNQTEPLNRRVAVKLIRFGINAKEVAARLEAERQVLARMNHPNIAQVYEAGSLENGQPYFVMEYVEGEPVDAWCGARRPGLAATLDLFARICDGVQHAHQRGVIHRDLKPSNVLVDASGRPRIIDFGIAKLVEDSEQDVKLTQVDQAIGTPQYMSPEQASFHREDVDTRSDVYALGVLLYELLTGRSPFDTDGKTAFEIRQQLCETDPARPSAVVDSAAPFTARELKGELDWIVARAMSREKERRYGSPAELAADIERYRAQVPVLAGPDEISYRLRKFVGRHKTGVAVTAVAVVAIVGGLTGTSIGLLRALEAERAAEESAGIANETVAFIENIFRAADSTQVRGELITAKEVVDRGVVEMRNNESLPWPARASMLQTMGRVYEGLGLATDAVPLFEESISLYEANIDSTDMMPEQYFRGRLGHIATIRRLGEAERAAELLDELIEQQSEAFGPTDERLVDARVLKQSFYTGQGDGDEAREHFRIASALLDAADASASARARLLTGIAAVFVEEANFDEAIAAGREAVALTESTLGPEHRETLINRSNLAWYLSRSRNYREAEAEFNRIIEVEERIFGRDHFDLGITLFNLGSLQRNIGRYRDSLNNYLRAREIWAGQLGPDHDYVLATTSNVAQIYYDLGEHDESEAMYLGLIEQEKALLGDDDPNRAFAMNNLGMVYHAIGELDKAETLLREAQELRIRTLGDGHDYVLDGYNNLGRVYSETGRFDRAHASFQKAIDIGTERFNESHPVVARGKLLKGATFIEQGKPAEAIPYLAAAIPVFESEWPEGYWETGQAKSLHGEALMMSGDLDGAREPLTTGLEILRNSEDRDGRHTKDAIERMIRYYERTGDEKKKAETGALLLEMASDANGKD